MRRNKPDTLLDLLYRYRGVILIACVPVVLVGVVVLMMPRSQPGAYTTEQSGETYTTEQIVGEKVPTVGTGTPHEKYAIVFDAGSTGSRVHIFKFLEVGGQLELQSDTFQQLKPGLSSYADEPQQAAESLQPLLDKALETVPEALHAGTAVKLGATAGLRLLPGGKADAILEAVRAKLRASPFRLDAATGVTILDGADEGAFAWLTLNYLLGKLGKEEQDTVAAIDLGGGSVQEAFAVSEKDAKNAPDTKYITKLAGAGKAYHVYVHSYLGYGLMAGRAAVLSWEEARAANPCVPTDHNGVYTYGGVEHKLVPHPDGQSFATCAKLTSLVLKATDACGAPQEQCSFSGVWGGNSKPKVFYVSSYFWDRAVETGLISDPEAIQWSLKPKDFSVVGEKACNTPLKDLGLAFPAVEAAQAPFLCLDLSFCHALLTNGFRVGEESSVTLVKRIKYRNEEVEAAWPLGAAINLLS